ncbi:MAG TPA: phosphate regulon transcriptional regulator PhoB [Gammaproteobacteria bacterium]|nr:phosphate regulon transcriptional regulator PhoB [Gammaproteobacteria bacterium]
MGSQKKVLVVEDEAPIREMLVFNLERAGYAAEPAASGLEARAAIANGFPDLVIMDWMLPDVSGLELTRQIKRDPETREIPIIMVTARAEEDDRVAGLDGGADDYLVKPFSPRELLARIRAALRRTPAGESQLLRAGRLRLDAAACRVTLGEDELALGPTEYRLLQFLMQHPNRVYNRGQLLDRVWGAKADVDERTVDVHIRRLRKALETQGYDCLIHTIRGIGYRFSPETAQSGHRTGGH